MNENLSYKINLFLIIIGALSILVLTISHLIYGNICPLLLGIPACYILLILIFLVLISHLKLVKDKNLMFFFGAFSSIFIATYFSFNQYSGLLQCPKDPFAGIPMCYLSIVLFSSILSLKIAELKS